MTTEEITARFDVIDHQNAELIDKIKQADFEGDIMLDPTLNKAQTFIHLANEAVVLFPQGAFPLNLAAPAIESTNVLLATCEKRYGSLAVKPMAQAFRALENLWYYSGAPLHPPEIFRKKIFTAEEKLLTAICAFNREILSQPTKRKPPRKKCRGRGPQTDFKNQQREIFIKFLERRPITASVSKITRAHQCWLEHLTEWKLAAENHTGYANYKNLARAI